MKKKTFIAIVIAEIGTVLTVFGGYACLVRHFVTKGIGIVVLGIFILASMLAFYRFSKNSSTIEISSELIKIIIFAFQSAIVLVSGFYITMCNMLMMGSIIGIIGIVLMLYLISMCKNLKC